MISLIVPTYNRAYALEQVLDTFYSQKLVSEIVFIDDCSNDNTFEVISFFKNKYTNIHTLYLKNEKRSGASFSRWVGVQNSKNEYILFCDDDEFLEKNYAEVCLNKLLSKNASIVSGRHFYRNVGESPEDAIKRFGNGLNSGPVFGSVRFKVYTDAIFQSDITMPFTHGIFLTTKKLLLEYKIDPFYSQGNGFREESDFQVNAFVNGHKILVTNDTHCVHMNMKEVRTGGQRVSRIKRYYWSVFYTSYFLKKYFNKLRTKMNIGYSYHFAIVFYALAELYDFFIRPFVILPKYIFQEKFSKNR